MSVPGLILQVAYRLRRHFWMGWSLGRWLGSLLVTAVLVALIRCWSQPWPALLLGGVFLGYVLVLVWASRRGYVRFRAIPDATALLHNAPPVTPLQVEELIPVRASGWFTVEGKDQYYVDLEADFERVGTGEFIVLGRVHPSRFLLLGSWLEHELGWWYIFFQPAIIRQVTVGHLHFGSRPRLALQVICAPDAETERTRAVVGAGFPRPGAAHPRVIYLAFEDASRLRRVWNDLLRDA